jgi:hypothetical protein
MIDELKKGPVDPSHGLNPASGAARPSTSEV